MGMTKMIEIDGKQVPFKASAAIPRIYRIKFHRDIYKDLDALGKAVGNGDDPPPHPPLFSLEMFENIACSIYRMSRRMWSLKKLYATDRPMTTPLFLLRCVQLGISIRDLDLLTIGMVNDMYAESSNDEYKGYAQIATQMDFDAF